VIHSRSLRRVTADVLIGVYPPAAPGAAFRPPPGRAPFPFSEAGVTLTHLGRGAVWLALRALGLGRGSRLAMPAYHCGSEVEAAHLAGAEIEFYRVDGQLRVDEEDLARAAAGADAVYLISHFGFPMVEPPAAATVIEDAAHGLFSAQEGRPLGSRGDAAIFCPRKSLGLPDGGALRLREGRAEPADGRPGRGAMARSGASLLAGRLALAEAGPVRAGATRLIGRASRGDAAAREGTLTETVIGEWDLEVADMEAAARSPSRLTEGYLRRVDGAAIRARRRRNYEVLRDELAELAPEPYRQLPDGVCPLYFPVRAANRSTAVAGLLEHGVRPLEIWPVPHPVLPRDRFAELNSARHELLALPVHQSLRPWHMERVLRAAKEVLHGRSVVRGRSPTRAGR
jgi:hypothetical protein